MSSKEPDTRIPLWLDVDTGHDDAFALLLATHHPEVSLLGVSTVFGNASLKNTTHNTLSILTALSKTSIAVYAGASKPFCRPAASAPDIHGETGLDGTIGLPTPAFPVRHERPAIAAMYIAISSQPADKVWIVATGALTNVALFFNIYPEMATHVAGISIMGGALGGGFTDAPMGDVGDAEGSSGRIGNWTPWAEFNIYVDPESAKAVLEHEVLLKKTVLVPLDLTHQFLATDDVQTLILHGKQGTAAGEKSAESPSPLRVLFHSILTFFAATYASVFGFSSGPPLHDPLAVAAIFAPGLFYDSSEASKETLRYSISVVTDGDHGESGHVRGGSSQCGRTIASQLPAGQAGVRIPKGLDHGALWTMLEQCLQSAELEASG